MTVDDPYRFVSKLRKLKFPNTFNPYVDRCNQYDKPHAPEIRARVLLDILQVAKKADIDAIWIGRDLGHRGGRRTGLALTDDFRFSVHTRRWGVDGERPTKDPMLRERTATVVWEMLEQIDAHIFLWNVFPIHPFPKGNTYQNRTHSAVERDAGIKLLLRLISLLRPRRLVAIGQDSARVMRTRALGMDVRTVRHPSYGGESLFRREIASLYRLEISDYQQTRS